MGASLSYSSNNIAVPNQAMHGDKDSGTVLLTPVITPIKNMWDEITYPFLNFNGATVEV